MSFWLLQKSKNSDLCVLDWVDRQLASSHLSLTSSQMVLSLSQERCSACRGSNPVPARHSLLLKNDSLHASFLSLATKAACASIQKPLSLLALLALMVLCLAESPASPHGPAGAPGGGMLINLNGQCSVQHQPLASNEETPTVL